MLAKTALRQPLRALKAVFIYKCYSNLSINRHLKAQPLKAQPLFM